MTSLLKLSFCRFPVLCVLVFPVLLLGCGGGKVKDVERFRVSGKVTYNGEPVPHGTIIFDPDPAQKNTGPQGMASIKNGAYDTSRNGGRGTVGGPMVISIIGTTHEVVTEGGEGRILFDHFSAQKELPKETTTLDFDVPAADPKSKKKK